MSETSSVKAIGVTIAVVGILALLIGLSMPATSTHTSETCTDDPTGFGQECVSGSVTTPNPLKGPVTGIGFLALLGGIGIVLIGGDDQHQEASRTPQRTANGGFAEELRERQEGDGASSDRPSSEPDVPAGGTRTPETTTVESRDSGSRTAVLPQNPVLGYGTIMLAGGILGYGILFSLTYALNFVLSFWMGALAGFFVAHHVYTEEYTVLRAVEIPLAFFGAWHGSGVLYQVLGALPRGVLGMLLLGVGAFLGAGIGVAGWRLIGEPAIESVWEGSTR